jgi:hypothetical protein
MYFAVWSLRLGVIDAAEPLDALDQQAAQYQADLDEATDRTRVRVVWNPSWLKPPARSYGYERASRVDRMVNLAGSR